jgi:platelet-activating factor acetylhydrolase
LTTTGDPALKVEEVGYAVFYPCAANTAGTKSVTWFPEPVGEMVRGYERFLGKKGFSFLCQ